MVNTNTDYQAMSDRSLISSIGAYIKQQRLNQNKTQAKIAEIAGINRWTMSKIENGEPISLVSFIQILRALNLLEVLNIFKTQAEVSPIALAKIEKQKRQRAGRNKNINKDNQSEW